jgi:hypothetical protein
MSTPVTEDQFEVSDNGIKHKPTEYEFNPYPGQPLSGNTSLRQHGNRLPGGEDYRPEEVEAMMLRLWAAYVKKKKL